MTDKLDDKLPEGIAYPAYPYLSQLRDIVEALRDPNCVLSEEEHKELHKWLLRISNAAEDAKQLYNSRAETIYPHVPPPKVKSTIGELKTVSLDAQHYLEYLYTLRKQLELQLGDASLYE